MWRMIGRLGRARVGQGDLIRRQRLAVSCAKLTWMRSRASAIILAPYRKYRRAGMQIEFMTIDVFTDRRFGGNPLAVVPDAAALDGALMQSIAAEFNLAETTFVLPPCDAAHTAEIRIFTPRAELPFAGHPNIGTAFALAALRGDAAEPLMFEEKAGLVRLDLLREGSTIVGARLAAPQPLTRGEDVAGEIVAAACGLAADAVATGNHAPCIASCGIPFVLAEIESAAALAAAR